MLDDIRMDFLGHSGQRIIVQCSDEEVPTEYNNPVQLLGRHRQFKSPAGIFTKPCT